MPAALINTCIGNVFFCVILEIVSATDVELETSQICAVCCCCCGGGGGVLPYRTTFVTCVEEEDEEDAEEEEMDSDNEDTVASSVVESRPMHAIE